MKLFTGVRIIFSSLILLGLVFGMQGCGGGGSTPGPIQSAAAGSYYQGTFTDKNATVTNNLLGIVNYDRFMFMNENSNVLYDATMNVTGTNYTANLIIYKDGKNPISIATATGTFVNNTSISIDINGSGDNTIDGSVTFNFSPDNTYNGNSDVSKIENFFWASPASAISNFTTSNVSPGLISAISNRAGGFFVNCVLDASLSKFTAIPDTNLYNVTIVVDTCTDVAAQGTYKGLDTF